MKTVTKIVMISCLFCYFAVLWMAAERAGVTAAFLQGGTDGAAERVGRLFPDTRLLYGGLILYTAAFALAAYIIYRVAERHGKEQDTLQTEAGEVRGCSERFAAVLSAYLRRARDSGNAADKGTEAKLRLLQRVVGALPPATVRNAAARSKLANMAGELAEMIANGADDQAITVAAEARIDDVNALRRSSLSS